MKRAIIVLTMLVFVTGLWARRIAIVVGCGQYPKKSGLAPLLADYDTEKVAKALEKNGWEIIVINATHENKPTAQYILETIGLERDSLLNRYSFSLLPDKLGNLGPNDEILFFFGGHGVTNATGADCIVPYDAIFNHDTCITPQKLIPIEWIKNALTRTGSLFILMIDACRNEINARNLSDHSAPKFSTISISKEPVFEINESKIETRKCLTIRSTGRNAYAHENQKAGEGVFTYFFRRLLTEEDAQTLADIAPADGVISLGEAFNYLHKETYNYVESLQGKRSTQIPWDTWEGSIAREHPFLYVETKTLSKERGKFTVLAQTRRDLPPYVFKQWTEENPAFQIQFCFQINGEQNESYLTKTLEDGTPVAEFDFDGNHNPIKNPFQSYYGINAFQFYFPGQILGEVITNKKYTLNFENIPFHAYRNIIISGACTYQLDTATTGFEVNYNQKNKMLKVWKITQTFEAKHADDCNPRTIKIFRTFLVLQNLKDPVILETISYQHHFVKASDIDPKQRAYCFEVPGKVEFEHQRITKIVE